MSCAVCGEKHRLPSPAWMTDPEQERCTSLPNPDLGSVDAMPARALPSGEKKRSAIVAALGMRQQFQRSVHLGFGHGRSGSVFVVGHPHIIVSAK